VPPEPSPARHRRAEDPIAAGEFTAAPRARASRANAMTRVVLPMPWPADQAITGCSPGIA